MNHQPNRLRNPNLCPNCGSGMIEGQEVDIEGTNCYQKVSCNDCYAEWTDVYTMTGYQDLAIDNNEVEKHYEV